MTSRQFLAPVRRKDGPRYHRLVDELGKRDVSVKDTMVLLSVCRMTAIRYLNDIVTNGDGHICAWAKGSSGPYSPLYTRGRGKTPPKPLATAERTATRGVVRKLGTKSLYKKVALILGLP